MKIPQEALVQIKRIQALVEIKELELAALKSHMATLLLEAVGVDIHKGDWILDVDSGELTDNG